MQTQVWDDWFRAYATLALRLDRLRAEAGHGMGLIYTGPDEWKSEVDSEEAAEPSRLVEDAEALRDGVPFGGVRAERLRIHLASMAAVAASLDGAPASFTDHAGACLGVPVEPEPEATFEAAHDRLDAALPPGPGSLAERLDAWRRAHHLPDEHLERVGGLAVDECLARTRDLVELPDDIEIDVRAEPGPNRGDWTGGGRGTVYLANGQPFNGAELLYLVAHEAFPGHIAESMLTYGAGADEPERGVRFMLSPAFVVSEGMGLHAPEIAFPGDEAQRWLTDHVLAPLGILPDGSDFATILDVKNVMWGVWANAAIMAAEGRPDAEIAEYLRRWALLNDDLVAWAMEYMRAPGVGVYQQCYFQGWRVVRGWLDHPDRRRRFARLLTEPLLPAELAQEGNS